MVRSNRFKIAASFILGLTAIFWLVTSLGQMMAGVPREGNNLVIMAGVVVLALLAWKRPLLGGILLSVFGVILAMYFFLLPTDLQTITPHLLLMSTPVTIAGLIFIEADWTSKKRD
jgi:peptidoglycan/LPS O-acetylase OafA/YrhL